MTAIWNLFVGAPYLNDSFTNALFNGTVGNAQATQFTLQAGSDKLVFTGTFTLSELGVLTGGTIAGLQVFSGTLLVLEASGYSMSASALMQALAVEDTNSAPLNELFDAVPMVVNGSPEWDFFGGTRGADRLFGNEGDDTVYAMGGDDFVSGGAGKDNLDGDQGSDTLDYSEKTDDLVVILKGAVASEVTVAGVVEDTVVNFENVDAGSGNDSITGDAQVNRLDGNAGDDTIFGNAGNDFLFGRAGNDLLDGGTGNDVLDGGAGVDVLTGGAGGDILSGGLGKDKLTGGEGADQFLFNAAFGKANADKITDFAGKDAIVLDDAVFKGLKTGTLKDKAYFEGPAAHDKNDRIILDKKGNLFYDLDGKGGKDAFLFAKVGKSVDLSADDFLVM